MNDSERNVSALKDFAAFWEAPCQVPHILVFDPESLISLSYLLLQTPTYQCLYHSPAGLHLRIVISWICKIFINNPHHVHFLSNHEVSHKVFQVSYLSSSRQCWKGVSSSVNGDNERLNVSLLTFTSYKMTELWPEARFTAYKACILFTPTSQIRKEWWLKSFQLPFLLLSHFPSASCTWSCTPRVPTLASPLTSCGTLG